MLIAKAYEFWQQASREERKRPLPLMVDLIQGVQFRSAGTTLGTLLQKGCNYSYELDYIPIVLDTLGLGVGNGSPGGQSAILSKMV